MKMNAILKDRNAFTLVELLFIVAIISVLAAMLLPQLQRAMEMSKSMRCMNNLRQVGFANYEYVRDNHGWTFCSDSYGHYGDVGRIQWYGKLVQQRYISVVGTLTWRKDPVLFCPVANWIYGIRGPNYTYHYLDGAKMLSRSPIGATFPKKLGAAVTATLPNSRLVLFGDACYDSGNWPCFIPNAGPGNFTFHLRHVDRTGPASFVDGHASMIIPDKLFMSTLWYAPWMYGSSDLVQMPFMRADTQFNNFAK